MRRSHVATALVALTAGLVASAALRRLAARRRPSAPVAAATGAPITGGPITGAPVAVAPVAASGLATDATVPAAPGADALVLHFAPRLAPAAAETAPAQRPAAPARCGDAGGRTKAGAPCGARATSGGRCRHHPLAA